MTREDYIEIAAEAGITAAHADRMWEMSEGAFLDVNLNNCRRETLVGVMRNTLAQMPAMAHGNN